MNELLPQIITILIAGGLSAAVTLYALHRNTKTARETTNATVSVQAQEADTHEFTGILAGYKDLLVEVKNKLAQAEAELTKVNERLNSLETDNRILSSHLDILEAGWPNPPGPPPRPTLGKARIQ